MHILWTIIIGFIVGVIAKFIMPGDKTEPTGFILTAILGIVGAFVATWLGQAVGWYGAGESAGFISSDPAVEQEPSPSRLRIAVFGGSYTQGSFDKGWWRVLEDELNRSGVPAEVTLLTLRRQN